MAGSHIATKWLNENDPSRKRTRKKRLLTRKRAKRSNVRFVSYDAWTHAALLAKREAEEKHRDLRLSDGFDGYSDFVRRFVSAHRKHDKPECLLVPFATDRPATVNIPMEGSMSAARYMCTIVHGAPAEGLVARHLCGNGHMSCVNPRHLAWGTDADNREDYRLHSARPKVWPEIDRETVEAVAQSDLPHNVVAVALRIPAVLVEAMRSGLCPKHLSVDARTSK